ncbi:unnamed protein product [marine sediment metagenome]|uniref:Uncharacterized protein n=1 Tax=marine sediment metagenome TaxID=412755 RepID=X0W7D7_9ZZZZ
MLRGYKSMEGNMTGRQYTRYRLWTMRYLTASTERQRQAAKAKLDALFAEMDRCRWDAVAVTQMRQTQPPQAAHEEG